jgi:hypothetical protein
MIYQPGDYVYPADLPRRVLCRVAKAESLDVRQGTGQVLKLEPLEGPWSPGTSLVRLDEYVIPARPRQLWARPTTHRQPHPTSPPDGQSAV